MFLSLTNSVMGGNYVSFERQGILENMQITLSSKQCVNSTLFSVYKGSLFQSSFNTGEFAVWWTMGMGVDSTQSITVCV